MHNFLGQDLQYFADVVIGNQSLHGILDTGSFEILVFSDHCHACGDVQALYSTSQSPTFQSGRYQTQHFFGSGSAYSVEGFERMSLGPLVLPNVSFWEVYDANMPVLQQSDFQAILGVGPPGVPEESAWKVAKQKQQRADVMEDLAERATFPFRRLVDNGLEQAEQAAKQSRTAAMYTATRNDSLLEILGVKSFSVCLGKGQGSDGYFTWYDDMPVQQPAAFVNLDVVGTHTWGVKMSGVHLGPAVRGTFPKNANDIACHYGCGAILDSGTSLLVMPRAAAARIAGELEAGGATCDRHLGVAGLPHLNFQLGEHQLSLPPEAYLGTIVGKIPASMSGWLRKDSEKILVCGLQLAVMTQEAETQFGPMWILGMPLFRQYYVNFDLGNSGNGNRSMNLALAGSDCTPIASRTALIGERSTRSVDAAGEISPVMSEEYRRFRTIDAAQLRVPRWAARAFAGGVIRI